MKIKLSLLFTRGSNRIVTVSLCYTYLNWESFVQADNIVDSWK